jgi:crotonobetainyl-CoA:carnitine CoA-transferase CaiB-like acyl-CoA transferase
VKRTTKPPAERAGSANAPGRRVRPRAGVTTATTLAPKVAAKPASAKSAARKVASRRTSERGARATKRPQPRARAAVRRAATPPSALPLEGVRILDLGTRIAAPFAGTLLADFGAEVIKIEQPGVGDFMRTIGPFEDGYSLWWAVEGRNKKSITLDLRKPAGQELLKRLVAESDVLLENFQPGTLEGWNIGPDALHAINPELVVSRVSVYGQTGPYRDRPGLDRNGIAMGGLLHLTGYKDRPPVRPGIIVSDYLTGIFNALGVMIALYERDRRDGAGRVESRARGKKAARARGGSGRGQELDLALYASILRILEHTVASYDHLGIVRGREGNRLANSAPLDNWQTKDDQFVSVIAAGDALFPRLARLIGRPDLLEDPRFKSLEARVANSEEINGIVAAWIRRHDADEIEQRCLVGNVPFARTYTVADICADPHVAARGDLAMVPDPIVGPVKMQGVYPRLSRTPGRIRSGAPELGAHNDEIYGKLLGLTARARARLRTERVI